MTTPDDAGKVTEERERIRAVNQRREQQLLSELYAPWQPASALGRAGRSRVAAALLHRAGAFPRPGDPCLEVGFGSLGWLGELITWGVRETDLHGVELDSARARRAQQALPQADLRVGDAADLPYENDTFRLVVASTLFTSILDPSVRRLVAEEITRVLAPGGALLWYDFAVNNPGNPHVRKVSRIELRALFPRLRGEVRSVTLAPPLARRIAPWSWVLATFFEAVPLFRTHLLAVLQKQHHEQDPGAVFPPQPR
jgi:SAM-dependent methyltransferase